MTEPTHSNVTLTEQPRLSPFSPVEPTVPKPHPHSTISATPIADLKPESGELARSPQPGLNMGRSLAQIVMVMVVLLMLVNIPISSYRAGLAQLIPQNPEVVIHDGLVLKGSGPEIYILEDYKLRRISSPEAFNSYFSWAQVSTVEDNLLEQLGHSQPIRRLVKCQSSPTVYAVENGQKRWVKEPPPAGQVKRWDQVGPVTCSYLQRLPDGLPIPEDAGLPPQP